MDGNDIRKFKDEIESLKHAHQSALNKLEGKQRELDDCRLEMDRRAGELLAFKRDLNDFLKDKDFWLS